MASVCIARALFCVAGVVVAACGGAAAQPLTIPAGDLKAVLDDYSRRTGTDLIYDPDEVAALHSPGADAAASPADALDELLRGTGVVAHRDPSGAVIVFRQRAQPEDAPALPDTEAVIVTGSRVIREGAVPPTPVTMIEAGELATATPSDVPDALNKLPMFQGSRNQRTTGGSTINWPGNFMNLRDFGINRTLILYDGRRVPYSDSSGDVDVNTLPLALLDRVDIVTGGASAVYGSDAITGVVNFVLDHKFEGVRITAQGGLSARKDDGSWKMGVVAGTTFWDGRAHVEASFEHYTSDGIRSTLDRPLGKLVPSELGLGTAASPYYLALNTRNVNLTPGGYIASGALAGLYFPANGVIAPFHHGQIDNGINEIGGDGGYAGQGLPGANANPWLVDTLVSDQGFARLDYQVTDGVTAYAQASLSQSSNYGISFVQQKAGTYAIDNVFLPDAARSLLAAAGQTSFAMSRSFQDRPGTISAAYTASNQATIGLSGSGRFVWDAHYTYGRTVLHEKAPGIFNQQRLTAALDAVAGPGGAPVCRVSLTPAGAAAFPGCVPFNAFGPTSDSDAAWAYTHDDVDYKTVNAMHDFGADISGSLFSDWAGPVALSLDLEHRILSFTNRSAYSPTATVDCTYLNPTTCSSSLAVWNGSTAALPTATESATEVAAETDVPLLRDDPLVGSIDFNGALRYTSYSISGPATTWKAGAVWSLPGGLTLRGSISRDIRAPTLTNLFAPASANYTAFTDYLTGVTGETTVSSQGNPSLKPEVSRTDTFGLVYKPNWLPDLGISIDYYQIGLNNVINSVSGGATTSQQVCIASGGTSPYCALAIRPYPIGNTSAANFPTRVLSESINAGKMTTHGVDAEAEYSLDLSKLDAGLDGMLGLRLLAAYQPSLLSVSPVPNAPITNQAGAEAASNYAVAAGRVNLSVSYSRGPFLVSAQERWHSSERRDPNPTLVYADPSVPQIFYTDMTVRYDLDMAGSGVPELKRASLSLTVENLFDRDPDFFISAGRTGAQGYTYPAPFDEDVIGRYFTLDVKFDF
jgi:outer membrane receptor protein involved in Fe transport